MAKAKATTFFCKKCGYESSRWVGQCPGRREWNTFVEELAGKKESVSGQRTPLVKIKSSRIEEINIEEQDRVRTRYPELDQVLGSGIVAGPLMLVGSDPRIGKSTLLLRVCRNLAVQRQKVLHISGEEFLKQTKLQASRIGEITGVLLFLCETNLDVIRGTIEGGKPGMVVTDSIQTTSRGEVSSAPGSVSQVRESTSLLTQVAKSQGIAIFIVGHVMKEDVVVRPRVLEYMMDTALYFEGERNASYRVPRGVESRFGSTNEIGVFETQEAGPVKVANPSECMLSDRPEGTSGAVMVCSLEGTKPTLLEVQTLVIQMNFGMLGRTVVDTDYDRVNLLMAMLEKCCHFETSHYDACASVVGNMKMNEPALDLAIVVALVSSLKDRPMDAKIITFGEVGLSGKTRVISIADQRVYKVVKLGFDTCILPQISLDKMKKTDRIRLVGVKNIREVTALL